MNAQTNQPISEQFERRYIPEPNSGCWLWLGMIQPGNGYGLFWNGEKSKRAHRVSWEIHYGEITPGLHVLHRCDNRLCVNPDHLFLGSHQDNMGDRNRKGRARGPKGESAPLAVLTEQDVIFIRSQVVRRGLANEMAKNFKVHPSTIERILSRKTWTHV